MNAPTKEEYNELSQPKFDTAYDEVKKFIKCCSEEGISVVASVVEGYKGKHLDLKTCEKMLRFRCKIQSERMDSERIFIKIIFK